MATRIEITPSKSYATRENAERAVAKLPGVVANHKLRYFIHTLEDGRFAPVFVGESAIQAGVHFHFNVIG